MSYFDISALPFYSCCPMRWRLCEYINLALSEVNIGKAPSGYRGRTTSMPGML